MYLLKSLLVKHSPRVNYCFRLEQINGIKLTMMWYICSSSCAICLNCIKNLPVPPKDHISFPKKKNLQLIIVVVRLLKTEIRKRRMDWKKKLWNTNECLIRIVSLIVYKNHNLTCKFYLLYMWHMFGYILIGKSLWNDIFGNVQL